MKGIFARFFGFCLIICVLFVFSSCTEREGDKRVFAQINKYKMMIEDLKYNLSNLPFTKDYLDRLIEKEILLQEAQRLGLDREKDFMKTIESYWEQALLKLLLERKAAEISGSIHVYDNEIDEYYRESGETKPLAKISSEIARAIRERKETQAMNAWITALKERSYIKINQDLLKKIEGGTL